MLKEKKTSITDLTLYKDLSLKEMLNIIQREISRLIIKGEEPRKKLTEKHLQKYIKLITDKKIDMLSGNQDDAKYCRRFIQHIVLLSDKAEDLIPSDCQVAYNLKCAIKLKPKILKIRASFNRCKAIAYIDKEDIDNGTFNFSIKTSNEPTAIKQVTKLMKQIRKAVKGDKFKDLEPYEDYIGVLANAYPKHDFSEKIGLMKRVRIQITSFIKFGFNGEKRKDFCKKEKTDPLQTSIRYFQVKCKIAEEQGDPKESKESKEESKSKAYSLVDSKGAYSLGAYSEDSYGLLRCKSDTPPPSSTVKIDSTSVHSLMGDSMKKIKDRPLIIRSSALYK